MTEVGQVTGATSVMVPGFLVGAVAAGVLAAARPVAEAGAWAFAGLGLAVLAAGLTAASLADLAAQNGHQTGYAHVRASRGRLATQLTGVLAVFGRVVAAGAVAALAGPAVVPSVPRAVSVVVVVVAAGLVITGVRPPTWSLYVAIVTVGIVVAVCFLVAPVAPAETPAGMPGEDDWRGIVSAGGLLFLGFVGVERLAPARPARAMAIVGAAGVVLAVVVFGLLRQLGGPRMAVSPAPLRDALAAADGTALTPLLAVGVAALAVLTVRPLLADTARVVEEMPELSGRAFVPLVAVAALVALLLPAGFALALAVTLLLAYYAMVNSAARLLTRGERSSWVRTGCCGLALCVVLSVNVSVPALLVGTGVLALGTLGCRMLTYRRRR